MCAVSLGVASTVMSSNKSEFKQKKKWNLLKWKQLVKGSQKLFWRLIWSGCAVVCIRCLSRCQGESLQRGHAFRRAFRVWLILVRESHSLNFEITISSLALWCSSTFASRTPLLSNAGSLKLTWGNCVDTAVKLNHEASQSPLASHNPTWEGPSRKKHFAFWPKKKAKELWATPLFFLLFFPPFRCQSWGYKTDSASESL